MDIVLRPETNLFETGAVPSGQFEQFISKYLQEINKFSVPMG